MGNIVEDWKFMSKFMKTPPAVAELPLNRPLIMECRWYFYSGITDIFKYLKIYLILL